MCARRSKRYALPSRTQATATSTGSRHCRGSFAGKYFHLIPVIRNKLHPSRSMQWLSRHDNLSRRATSHNPYKHSRRPNQKLQQLHESAAHQMSQVQDALHSKHSLHDCYRCLCHCICPAALHGADSTILMSCCELPATLRGMRQMNTLTASVI